MIDRKIMSLILNYKELYEDFVKYDVLIDSDCRKLKEIVDAIFKKNKAFNSDLIINHINQFKDFDINLFYEIYDSELDESKYEGFLHELLTRKSKLRLLNYSRFIQTEKEKNHIDIKQDVIDIVESIENPYNEDIKDCKDVCLEKIEGMKNKEPSKKIKSCFNFLDSRHRGYGMTNWIILAAQESAGKTSRVLALIVDQLKEGMRVGFISCEMSRSEIMDILYCLKANVSFEKYDNKTMDKIETDKIISSVAWFYDQPLFIVDAKREWLDIKNRIKLLKSNKEIDIIYIDHLHHIRSKDYKDEYSRLQYISGEIKDSAKTLELPHFTIAILNDEGKGSSLEGLQLRHVKGNKDIAYDCDIGILMGTKEWATNGNFKIRRVKYFIRKNRNGQLGTWEEEFNCDTRNFKEVESWG